MHHEKKRDNKFNNVCKNHNIKLFRGPTNNDAKRIIYCAIKNSINIIIRIAADCPTERVIGGKDFRFHIRCLD